MNNDLESAARSVMNSPQGLKIIKTLDSYNAAMNTENGRQFIALLSAGGGDALKHAAGTALGAARDPGRVLLQDLLSTKDGAALAGKVIELLGL